MTIYLNGITIRFYVFYTLCVLFLNKSGWSDLEICFFIILLIAVGAYRFWQKRVKMVFNPWDSVSLNKLSAKISSDVKNKQRSFFQKTQIHHCFRPTETSFVSHNQ